MTVGRTADDRRTNKQTFMLLDRHKGASRCAWTPPDRQILPVSSWKRGSFAIEFPTIGRLPSSPPSKENPMTEPLFSSCIRGARGVLSLARDSLSAAIARNGPDAPLAYPGTAYEIPGVFGLTDLAVTTLRGAEPALLLAEGMIRERPTAENALDPGAATLLCADVLEALHHADGTPYPAPCVGFVPAPVLRKLGIFMVAGSVPGVAGVVGKASAPP